MNKRWYGYLGSIIGNPLYLNEQIWSKKSLNYARLCIEVPVGKEILKPNKVEFGYYDHFEFELKFHGFQGNVNIAKSSDIIWVISWLRKIQFFVSKFGRRWSKNEKFQKSTLSPISKEREITSDQTDILPALNTFNVLSTCGDNV